RAFSGGGPAPESPVPPALRLDGSRCLGQEGGQAKVASGWPPGFSTLAGSSLNPGGSVNTHCVQASVSEHFRFGRPIAAALCAAVTSVAVSQSVNQRWRERPRWPALRVTPGRRDGVVHAIVGPVARRRFRAVNVQGERAVRVHVFGATFAGRLWLA